MLKNELGASTVETAQFRFVCSIPVYLGLFIGLVRDRWSPFGMGDRGYLLLLAPIIGSTYLAFFHSRFTIAEFSLMMLCLVCLFKLLVAACHALLSTIAQQKQMSGQFGALLLIAKNLPEVLGAAIAAVLIQNNHLRHVFLIAAIVAFASLLILCWKPADVMQVHADRKPTAIGSETHFYQDLMVLAKHKPIYPALLMLLLFNFAPGFNTPLQFHLTNQLHAPDSSYGVFLSIFFAALLPGFYLYSYLCRHLKFMSLLWLSIGIAIPQMLFLGLIRSEIEAYFFAVPMGLVAGLAYSALYDLAIRSCPEGLQGSFMMLVAGALAFSDKLGDLVGSALFQWRPDQGLFICGVLTTAVYSLMLPTTLWVSMNSKRNKNTNGTA